MGINEIEKRIVPIVLGGNSEGVGIEIGVLAEVCYFCEIFLEKLMFL